MKIISSNSVIDGQLDISMSVFELCVFGCKMPSILIYILQ